MEVQDVELDAKSRDVAKFTTHFQDREFRRKFLRMFFHFLGAGRSKMVDLANVTLENAALTYADFLRMRARALFIDSISWDLLPGKDSLRTFVNELYLLDTSNVERAVEYVHSEREQFFTTFCVDASSPLRALGDDFDSKLGLLNHALELWGVVRVEYVEMGYVRRREFSFASNVEGQTIAEAYGTVEVHLNEKVPPRKRQKVVKAKPVPLAKGMSTFSTLLFDDKRPASVPQVCPVVLAHGDVLAKVLLPAVNDILLRMEEDARLKKMRATLRDYDVSDVTQEIGPSGWRDINEVEVRVGMILCRKIPGPMPLRV